MFLSGERNGAPDDLGGDGMNHPVHIHGDDLRRGGQALRRQRNRNCYKRAFPHPNPLYTTSEGRDSARVCGRWTGHAPPVLHVPHVLIAARFRSALRARR